MNRDRALIRARALWGKQGYTKHRPRLVGAGANLHTHAVGLLYDMGGVAFFMPKASGSSYEEAFANYEAGLRRDRAQERWSRLVDACRLSRAFIAEHLDLEGAADLDNHLATLLDEIEGGS